jgi:hypothetical protein
MLLIIGCQKLERENTDSLHNQNDQNDVSYLSRESSTQAEINTEILNILENESVNQFIENSMIDGYRETINLRDLDSLGVDTTLLFDANITQLYLPYIELNNENREGIIIINLDDVITEEIYDLVSEDYVSQSDVMSRCTVMYKTKEHEFDETSLVDVEWFNIELPGYVEFELQLEGKWLPWRRCYCKNNRSQDQQQQWFENGTGSCSAYRQDPDRCGYVCDHTSFFNQECDKDFCEAC